jgi:CRP-like cAMP-binding protein
METLPTLSLVERTLLLKDISLFSDLSLDDLVQIAQTAQERWFTHGMALCQEGEMGDELFIVAAGQVRVTRQAGDQTLELATRPVGEVIGEMSIIESVPRSASVTALGEVRTLVIRSEMFKAILRQRPEVSLAVMRVLSRRLRERS